MPRLLLFVWFILASWLLGRDEARADDAPPIVIASPDQATTYPFGSVREHSLLWNRKTQMLIARIVFNDINESGGSAPDDTHEFRLPGVKLDPAKGIFYALTARGEIIPLAHWKKELFFKAIETLPNAVVRVQHPHGQVTVLLEAVRPGDPALRAPPANPDGNRSIDLRDLLQ